MVAALGWGAGKILHLWNFLSSDQFRSPFLATRPNLDLAWKRRSVKKYACVRVLTVQLSVKPTRQQVY